MATKTTNSISRTFQVFEDLDKYRNFCRDFGYRFVEADLYNQRSHVFRQFQRFVAGKPVKDQWEFDYAKWKEKEASKYRA